MDEQSTLEIIYQLTLSSPQEKLPRSQLFSLVHNSSAFQSYFSCNIKFRPLCKFYSSTFPIFQRQVLHNPQFYLLSWTSLVRSTILYYILMSHTNVLVAPDPNFHPDTTEIPYNFYTQTLHTYSGKKPQIMA